jgi:DNA-binding LacI/PurR family transcriptional regulator
MTIVDLQYLPRPAGEEDNEPDSPTLAHVAQLAGVSLATASRVLNNSAGVSMRAREQVRDAVTHLGYVRRRAARATTAKRVRAVAAVVCANNNRLFSDPFFARIISGATDELAGHDVPLMVIPVTDERLPLIEPSLHSGHYSGVLLVGAHDRHSLTVSLPAAGVPVTMIGRPLHATRASYVDCDNKGGARLAVEHLIRQGRRNIATIAGPPNMAVGADRLSGYRESLARAGLPEMPIAYGDFSQASAVHAMWRLLDQRPGLDAVFVASDIMATGALHALRRAGRRVPDDVAVIGFDDIPLAAHTNPPLTTVRQPIEECGTLAARRLLSIIDGDAEEQDPLLPTTLVARVSA